MNLINADIKPGMMCQDTIINNRLDISICLDTGASASCIREEVYRKLKIGKPLTHAKIKVTGIGESSIRNRPISLGKVKQTSLGELDQTQFRSTKSNRYLCFKQFYKTS